MLTTRSPLSRTLISFGIFLIIFAWEEISKNDYSKAADAVLFYAKEGYGSEDEGLTCHLP